MKVRHVFQTLFCCAAASALSAVAEVAPVSVIGTSLDSLGLPKAMTLAFGGASAGKALYVAWGDVDGGGSLDEWAYSKVLLEKIPDAQSEQSFDLPDGAKYVRFFCVPDGDESLALKGDGKAYIVTSHNLTKASKITLVFRMDGLVQPGGTSQAVAGSRTGAYVNNFSVNQGPMNVSLDYNNNGSSTLPCRLEYSLDEMTVAHWYKAEVSAASRVLTDLDTGVAQTNDAAAAAGYNVVTPTPCWLYNIGGTHSFNAFSGTIASLDVEEDGVAVAAYRPHQVNGVWTFVNELEPKNALTVTGGTILPVHYGTVKAVGSTKSFHVERIAMDAGVDYRALADDPLRPQLHLTTPRGWLNDPNGLSYYNGEWHAFCQHNTAGTGPSWEAGRTAWYHFVSKDLAHWEALGDAVLPQTELPGARTDGVGGGAAIAASGSAITDADGTAGFGENVHVLAYTALSGPGGTGRLGQQCLAWSPDGRTYFNYTGNPMMGPRDPTGAYRADRDPRLVRYGDHWAMALYTEYEAHRNYEIFTSTNLKDWTPASRIDLGAHPGVVQAGWLVECPGLEKIRIEGEDAYAWVIWGGEATLCRIGAFDGETFSPYGEKQSTGIRQGGGSDPFYAGQTFSDAPGGRTIWIPWFKQSQSGRPGAAFNQMLGIPQELTLRRKSGNAFDVVRHPAAELAQLRDGDAVALGQFDGDLGEVSLACTLAADGSVAFDLRGLTLSYSAASQQLTVGGTAVSWPIRDGQFGVTVYLDRGAAEIFSADGLNMLPVANVLLDNTKRSLSVTSQSGVSNGEFKAWKLKSIWSEPSATTPEEEFSRRLVNEGVNAHEVAADGNCRKPVFPPNAPYDVVYSDGDWIQPGTYSVTLSLKSPDQRWIDGSTADRVGTVVVSVPVVPPTGDENTPADGTGLLPKGYRLVPWIKGDLSAQPYYETDYVPNPQTDRIVADVMFPVIDNAHHRAIWNSRQAGPTLACTLQYVFSQGGTHGIEFIYYDGRTPVPSRVATVAGHRYLFEAFRNDWWMDDAQYTVGVNTPGFAQAGTPVSLFAGRGSPEEAYGNFSDMYLYSFRVYRDGKLIHNLLPVVDAEGNPGLWDACDKPMQLTRHGVFTADTQTACARVVIAPIPTQPFLNGQTVEPAVTAIDVKSGKPIDNLSGCFNIAYSANRELGRGKVTLTGRDGSAYAGQRTYAFFDIAFRCCVTADAKGGGNGQSWTDDGVNAPMTFAEAWSAAAATGGEVWLKKGTHALSSSSVEVPLAGAVTVRGGFDGTETLPDERTSQDDSTIDGVGQYSGLAFSNAQTVEFEQVRFTRTKGFAVRKTSGSGALSFRKCRISSNLFGNTGFDNTGKAQTATNWGINNFGGVVQGYGATAAMFTAEDCVFDGNALDGSTFNVSGGAVGLVSFFRATFDNCLFASNSVPSGEGAGLCVGTYATSVKMNGCAFRGNYAVTKRASVVAFWENRPAELDHCLFAGNYCPGVDSAGSGIVRRWSSVLKDDVSSTFRNCTFAYNILAQSGVLSLGSNQKAITVDDSIFFGNVKVSANKGAGYATGTDISYESGAITVRRTLFGGEGTAYVDTWGDKPSGSATLTDCVFANPKFVTTTAEFKQLFAVDAIPLDQTTTFPGYDKAVALDCHVRPRSKAIDAGDPAADWSTEPRPNGERANIGVYGGTPEVAKSAGGLLLTVR